MSHFRTNRERKCVQCGVTYRIKGRQLGRPATWGRPGMVGFLCSERCRIIWHCIRAGRPFSDLRTTVISRCGRLRRVYAPSSSKKRGNPCYNIFVMDRPW